MWPERKPQLVGTETALECKDMEMEKTVSINSPNLNNSGNGMQFVE